MISDLALGINGAGAEAQQFSELLEGGITERLNNIFKQNGADLVKDLSISKLIENNLRDKTFMDMTRALIRSEMQDPDNKKSDGEALKLKEIGNREYKLRNLNEALQNYNDSIVYGTPSSLAVGYSNRSAVLFHMNDFNKCLTDIERALSYECKDPLKLKLFLRRTKCFLKLKRIDDAVKTIESLESWLESADLLEGMKKETKKEMSKFRDDIQGSDSDVPIDACPNSKPKLSHGHHANIPLLSAAVDVKYSAQKGRHAVANRPLRVGDVLLIEKPYVCALDGKFTTEFPKDHRCTNCTGPTLMSTVPCPHCSRVRYCSESCRDESWIKHHYMECGYIYIMQPSTSETLLPLIMLLAAGVENVIAMKEELEKSPNHQMPGFNAKGEFEHEKYYPIYHLFRFKEDTDLDFKDRVVNLCVFSLTNLDLQYRIKIDDLEMDDKLRQSRKKIMHSQGPNGSCFMWEERLFLANILARHLLSIRCNSSAIEKCHRLPSDISPVGFAEIREMGSAIHPVYNSFFNHSCDPNVGGSIVASTTVLTVFRDVSKGEELCVSYRPKRYGKSRDDRQTHLLQNYCFTCKCSACEDEKSIENMPFSDMNNETMWPKILRCGSQYLITLTYTFFDAVSNLQKRNFPATLMRFERCLTQIEREHENSNRKQILSTKFWNVHHEIYCCMGNLLTEINDDSFGKETFRNFDGTSETKVRPRNFELLLDVLEHSLESLPDFRSEQGLESDLISNYKLRYFQFLLRMDHVRRGNLRRNPRWIALAKEGLEFLKVFKKHERKCGAVEGHLSYVDDVYECLSKCVNG